MFTLDKMSHELTAFLFEAARARRSCVSSLENFTQPFLHRRLAVPSDFLASLVSLQTTFRASDHLTLGMINPSNLFRCTRQTKLVKTAGSLKYPLIDDSYWQSSRIDRTTGWQVLPMVCIYISRRENTERVRLVLFLISSVEWPFAMNIEPRFLYPSIWRCSSGLCDDITLVFETSMRMPTTAP